MPASDMVVKQRAMWL